ncbi:MAG: hypothetical protein Q4C65_15050, partial [Eubacteriales bacterium]|nr:hypothetical protein [Eubacteriales bacterium]
MEKKELFRTTVFGGYQRDDVMEYIRSLEEEKEAEIKLAERESVECRAALEQENLLRQKLSEQLEETLGKNEALRRENEASAGENSRLQQLVEETEKQLAALQEKLQESREEAETARQETEVARRET